MKTLAGALAALVIVSAPLAAGANLVNNPGFEAFPDFTSWNLFCNVGFCEISGPPTSAHGGSYSADLGPFSDTIPLFHLSQVLATTAGQTYEISWWFYSDDGSSGDPTRNRFSVSFGGTPLFDQTDILSGHSGGWQPFVYSATATSGTTTLDFGFFNKPGHFHLDDVSVETTGVPEPGTLVLLGVGLAGLVQLRRHRLSEGRADARRDARSAT